MRIRIHRSLLTLFPREHSKRTRELHLVVWVVARVCGVDVGPFESPPASLGLYVCCIERVEY